MSGEVRNSAICLSVKGRIPRRKNERTDSSFSFSIGPAKPSVHRQVRRLRHIWIAFDQRRPDLLPYRRCAPAVLVANMRPKNVRTGTKRPPRSFRKGGGKLCVATRRRVSTFQAKDVSKLGIANADSFLQHRRKHRLKIAGRATDNLKHLRRRSLLFERFCKLPRTLLFPLEQPHILDGDNRLVGEGRDQLDLFVVNNRASERVSTSTPIGRPSRRSGMPSPFGSCQSFGHQEGHIQDRRACQRSERAVLPARFVQQLTHGRRKRQGKIGLPEFRGLPWKIHSKLPNGKPRLHGGTATIV